MPEHPLAAVYVFGVYTSLAVIAVPLLLRPWVLDLLAEQAKIPRAAFVAILAVAYGPLWPVTWMVALAQLMSDRRGGDG
jgi:hypothetical protein